MAAAAAASLLMQVDVVRPGHLHLHPHLHLPYTSSFHARTQQIHHGADQKQLSLPLRENRQPAFPPSVSPTRAAPPSWRCRAASPSGDESGALEAVSPQSGKRLQDLDESQASLLARIDDEEYDLLPVAAARLLKVEKDKQKYLGKALRAGKGAAIADLLQIFSNLLERPYGGGESVANAGGAVIERVVKDVQELRGQDGVNEQMLFELLKVIRFLEMDMELIRAAKQNETLWRRLDTAQMHCKQARAIANSF